MRVRGILRVHIYPARRLALAATGLALVAGVLPVVGGAGPGITAIAHADDTTASQNLLRNGWDQNEPNMSPSVVPSFIQRWTDPTLGESQAGQAVSGSVYAQPLVVGSTVIVATENDQVYGLNAGTGAVLWHTSLGTPVDIATESGFSGCTDLVPNIGVTGTPAYDPVTGHIFMFADEMVSGSPEYFMVEMDTAGHVVSQTPITGIPSNDSHIAFNAKFQMERPGVMVMNGAVYGAFASHCDFKPYSGYVAKVDIATHTATLWSDESGVTFNQAGIWQSGGGLMSDGSGRIFVASGNGVSPVKRAGSSPGGQLAESVIRLGINTNGTLSAKDFFSPANAPTLDAGDVDYGAGGPVGVPFTDAGFNMLAQIGKDGRVWLLNTAGLGGREQGTNSTDNDLFVSKAYGEYWGHPAIFGNTTATRTNAGTSPIDNDFLISVGKNDVLRMFRFAVTAGNKPWLTNMATSSLTYGFTSGSPVVTSNGADPTSAVIWEVYTPPTAHSWQANGAGSELEAYTFGNAIASGGHPSSCSSSAPCKLPNIWHSQTFTSSKFSIPATSQGWVYVGTRDGHVLAFAAPSAAAPAAATTATLPQTAVGATSSQPVSVTANKTVTFTGVSASTGASNETTPASEFAAGQVSETKKGRSTPVPVSFPVTLAKGDKLTVQTSFAPVAPGTVSGSLTFATDSSATPTVDVPLSGEGTQDGIYAEPTTQAFPLAPDQGVIPVPVGIKVPEIVDIANLGTVTQTVTSVTPPSGQFTASNLPAVGTKIIPGESIAVQVTYAPTSPGPATGSFTVVGSSGQKAVVALTGIGTAAVSQLTATVSPAVIGMAHAPVTSGTPVNPTVNLGSVPVGTKVTAFLQVSNTGNTQSTVIGSSNLSAPFAAPLKPDAGLPFNADSDLSLPVTFAPTTKGTFTTQYKIGWQDLNGRHTLVVTITGTGV